MTTAPPPPTDHRSRSVVVGVAAALLIALAATLWIARSDERRVNAACDTYLGYRQQLRFALGETNEANERALEAKAESQLEKAEPDAVAFWLSEVRARMQLVDDTCLYVARRSWL